MVPDHSKYEEIKKLYIYNSNEEKILNSKNISKNFSNSNSNMLKYVLLIDIGKRKKKEKKEM